MITPKKVKSLLRRIANSIQEYPDPKTTSTAPPYNFLTGSHAYGKPTKKSDIDLVVMVDDETEKKLRSLTEYDGILRFGKLSLIVCHSELEMAVWRIGTQQMKDSGKKFSKYQAKAVLDKIRKAVDLEDRVQSGGS